VDVWSTGGEVSRLEGVMVTPSLVPLIVMVITCWVPSTVFTVKVSAGQSGSKLIIIRLIGYFIPRPVYAI